MSEEIEIITEEKKYNKDMERLFEEFQQAYANFRGYYITNKEMAERFKYLKDDFIENMYSPMMHEYGYMDQQKKHKERKS